jgi:hypothetical protein
MHRLNRECLSRAERLEGEHLRWRKAARGEEALRHMQALERLMPEMGGEAVGEEGVA